MRQDLAQRPRNLINSMRKYFYINGNRTTKADDNSVYDPLKMTSVWDLMGTR